MDQAQGIIMKMHRLAYRGFDKPWWELSGRPIRIEIVMLDVDFYSFRFFNIFEIL